MKFRPYMYPLMVGAIPSTGAPQTVTLTAFAQIPANSLFVWTHTLNATLQATGGASGTKQLVMLSDSKSGPFFNEPLDLRLIAGTSFNASVPIANNGIRPFPLPEGHVFERGAVLTATYTFTLTPNGGDPSFANVGIILCGLREVIEE